MTPWILVLAVSAPIINNPTGEASIKSLGIETVTNTSIPIETVTNTFIPTITTIDFNDEKSCEAAAKKLMKDFTNTQTSCIERPVPQYSHLQGFEMPPINNQPGAE